MTTLAADDVIKGEGRRSGGRSRSSRSYSGGSRSSYRYKPGRYSYSRRVVTHYYRPFGGYTLVVGRPYYDAHYGYYYDGHQTYMRTRANPSAKYMYTKGTFPFNDSAPGSEEDLTSLTADESITGEGRRRSYTSRKYVTRSYRPSRHVYISRPLHNPSAKYLHTKGTFPFNDSAPGLEEDLTEGRRGGGGSRSGRSSGRSSSSRSYSRTTRTYHRYRPSGRTIVHGYYRPYGGHVLIVGRPFYDAHYGYYYDGMRTFRRANPSAKYMYTKGTFPFNDSQPWSEEELTSLNANVEQMSPTLLISSGIALLVVAFFMLSLYIAPK